MYKVLLDSDEHLLSYSTLINPLEPDVHHMSLILSISIDFYPDLIFQIFDLFTLEREKILRNGKREIPAFSRTFK